MRNKFWNQKEIEKAIKNVEIADEVLKEITKFKEDKDIPHYLYYKLIIAYQILLDQIKAGLYYNDYKEYIGNSGFPIIPTWDSIFNQKNFLEEIEDYWNTRQFTE